MFELEVSQQSPAVSDIEKVAEKLVSFYENHPVRIEEKAGKIKTVATAFNMEVRPDQKVTEDEVQRAIRILGIT